MHDNTDTMLSKLIFNILTIYSRIIIGLVTNVFLLKIITVEYWVEIKTVSIDNSTFK